MREESSGIRETNQLASDWLHWGFDLLNEKSEAGLKKAVRCFDEAIALRRRLPLESEPFFRYGLSAGWINRGDALAGLDESHLEEAVTSYDEALALLETLPLEENLLYPRRLAITWSNRGLALQRRVGNGDGWEAIECFREAIAVLELPCAENVSDRTSLLAGVYVNLASALLGSASHDGGEVLSMARQALALVCHSERADSASLEVGLRARHLICRLAVLDSSSQRLRTPLVEEGTDAADEVLALVRLCDEREWAACAKLVAETVRFGSFLYSKWLPNFLGDFLGDCLDSSLLPLYRRETETLDAMEAAIWSAVEKLQPPEWQAERFDAFFTEVQALRKIEQRLKQVRNSSAALAFENRDVSAIGRQN